MAQEEEEEKDGRRKKRKSGPAWKEWREMYTPLTEADKQNPYYFTKLGPDWADDYPAEIQLELQNVAGDVESTRQSKETEYDMGDGWVYTLRVASGRAELQLQLQLAVACERAIGDTVGGGTVGANRGTMGATICPCRALLGAKRDCMHGQRAVPWPSRVPRPRVSVAHEHGQG